MSQQLTLFESLPTPPREQPGGRRPSACAAQGSAPCGASADFHCDAARREIEPSLPMPPAILEGTWKWNARVLEWRILYDRPPISLAPRGVTADRHGVRLLAPAGFIGVDWPRLRGRCPHCRSTVGRCWHGRDWHGWSDARVAAAFETAETSGVRCYGLTVLDVAGFGKIAPLSHYTRWGAGYCIACGTLLWNDFRVPCQSYFFHPPPPAAPYQPVTMTPGDVPSGA
jgi:hypothetical protein